jgi:hypothetical protein
MMTATWARRRELSGAAMANLDDFGKAALALTL